MGRGFLEKELTPITLQYNVPVCHGIQVAYSLGHLDLKLQHVLLSTPAKPPAEVLKVQGVGEKTDLTKHPLAALPSDASTVLTTFLLLFLDCLLNMLLAHQVFPQQTFTGVAAAPPTPALVTRGLVLTVGAPASSAEVPGGTSIMPPRVPLLLLRQAKNSKEASVLMLEAGYRAPPVETRREQASP